MSQNWTALSAVPPPPFAINSSGAFGQAALQSWTRLASQLQLQALTGPVDPNVVDILNLLGVAMLAYEAGGGNDAGLGACIAAADRAVRWCGIGP